MSEASFASLEPSLLARKGGAKPAMRPQLAPIPELVDDEQLEDLGWNDMGDDDQPSGGNVVSLGRQVPDHRFAANEDGEKAGSVASPILQRREREEGPRDLAAAAMPLPSERGDAELVQRKPAGKACNQRAKGERRAAFTLRLDADRHLKLRLASTMQGTSAQALVTEALDAVFDQIEDLEALVARIKPN